MLIDRQRSALLVVDLQERLLPHIDGHRSVLDHAVWLVRLARELAVPLLVSEQYPQGIGPTLAVLRELTFPTERVEKLHFSCVAAQCLKDLPGSERAQIVITGIEAHVCVLQTAIELRALGKEVFVVAEAVGSRRAQDRQLALERMRAHGVEIVSREMVAFEWLRQAGTETFRRISREYLR